MMNLKCGSKFQLTKDFTIGDQIYPSGLVVSLVNYTVYRPGTKLLLKVLKAKPIVKRYYEDICAKLYLGGTWRNWENIKLRNSEVDEFFERVNNGDIVSFDSEYEILTQ